MELVAMELKAQGLFVARTLSYEVGAFGGAGLCVEP